MKKIIAVALVAVFCLGVLAGCSSAPSPTQVTQNFLDAVKASDSEEIQNSYSNGSFSFEDMTSSEASEEGTQLNEETANALSSKLLEFDYELSNEQINGDTATVDVAITTYPLGDAFSSFFSDYLSQAFAAALSGASQDELSEIASGILLEKINAMEKTYSGTATISLTKVDDQWKVDQIDQNGDFMNVLTGGLVDTVNRLASAYDTSSE